MKQTCDECLGTGTTTYKLWFLRLSTSCSVCGGAGNIEVSDGLPVRDHSQWVHIDGVPAPIVAIAPLAMLSNGTIAGLPTSTTSANACSSMGKGSGTNC